MASYLWLRGSCWYFQLKPPKDLQPVLGSTPIRIRLPCRNHREASRYARQLAGLAEQHMGAMRYSEKNLRRESGIALIKAAMQKPEYRLSQAIEDRELDPDERKQEIAAIHAFERARLIDFLKEKIGQLADLAAEHHALDKLMASAAPKDREALVQAQQVIARKSLRGWSEFATQWLEDFDALLKDYQSKRAQSMSLQRELDELMSWKPDELAHHIAAIAELKEETARDKAEIDEIRGDKEMLATQQLEINERILNKGPLLSECYHQFINVKKDEHPTSREPGYFKQRLELFIALVGDKPVGEYRLSDLSTFAFKLQDLPKRHGTNPDYDHIRARVKKERDAGLQSSEGKAIIEAYKEKDRQEVSVSYTTVKTGYVGKVKTALRWLCSEHRVAYPLEGTVQIPKLLPTSTMRLGLDDEQLNKLFVACTINASERRPEDVWLPLLAYLTGARIGELVLLQPHNIRERHGVYVIDLISRLSDSNGVRNRPIKTRESLRLFALHNVLVELGFVNWARKQGELGYDYVFPDLHTKNIKRPTNAASKRFQRLFDRLGMGKNSESQFVFHSLRHSFKDWARSSGVEERTITLQAGHSLDGIALRYGSRWLRSDELKKIANMPLPPGIDFNVFKGARPRSTVPPSLVKTFANAEAEVSVQAMQGHQKQLVKKHKKQVDRSSIIPGDKDESKKFITSLRKSLGLSQIEFACQFNIPLGNLRDWEQARTKPGRMWWTQLQAIQRDQGKILGDAIEEAGGCSQVICSGGSGA
jgi:integrase/DNA-binding transcriptional regulator YiaG